jgi:hypothetical protein
VPGWKPDLMFLPKPPCLTVGWHLFSQENARSVRTLIYISLGGVRLGVKEQSCSVPGSSLSGSSLSGQPPARFPVISLVALPPFADEPEPSGPKREPPFTEPLGVPRFLLILSTDLEIRCYYLHFYM